MAASNDKFLSHLRCTYDVDYSKPHSITTKSPIFDNLRSGHIIASQKSHATGAILSYESQEEYNEATSASLRVDVNYGAFKASGSMSTQSLKSRKKKTFRFDQRVTTEQWEVQLNMTSLINPQKILGEEIIRLINDEDFEMKDFTCMCGPFIAVKVAFGGIMENTVLVEQDGRTSKSQVKAKLSAGVDSLFGGASASASGSSSSASWNNNVRIQQQFHCEGGKTSIWLNYEGPAKGQPGNFKELRDKWTSSITDGNLYPVRVELMPVWRVLKKVNRARAAEIEKYWLSKWRKEGKSFEGMGIVGMPTEKGLVKTLHHMVDLKATADLKADRTVECSGYATYGGYLSPQKKRELVGVCKIVPNRVAFAAIREDNSVICWGLWSAGGEPDASIQAKLTNVQDLVGYELAFAARRFGGEIVVWGTARCHDGARNLL